MAGSRRITIEFLGRDVSAGKTAKQVEGKFGGLQNKLERAGSVAGKLLAGGIAAGGAAMVKFGNQASDLAEAQSKANVVFGKSVGVVNDFAKDAAQTAGLSKRFALEAQGTLGNLLLSMGKTQPEAAKMSSGLTQLAADIGSFNNVDTSEVLAAMRSGLTGEIAPLRRFGVNLTDATLKAKAMKLGLYDGKGALDVSAKSTAAYQLILEQTQTAQGDFARTSNGLANKQRIMKAEFDNLTTTLGQKALPVMLKITDWAVGAIDWMGKHKTLVKVLAGVIGTLTATLWLASKAMKAVAIAQVLINVAMTANPIGLVVVAIAALVAGLIYAWKHSRTFREVVTNTFEKVGDACDWMWNKVIKPVFGFITRAWLTVVGGLIRGAANAFGWVPGIGPKLRKAADKFEDFRDSVNNKLDGIKPAKVRVEDHEARNKVREFSQFYNEMIGRMNRRRVNVHYGAAPGTPIPGNARGTNNWRGGSTWVGERGPEIVNLPRGSKVIPATRSARMAGGGGTTVNIHIHGVTDKKGAAREIRAALLEYKRSIGGAELGIA